MKITRRNVGLSALGVIGLIAHSVFAQEYKYQGNTWRPPVGASVSSGFFDKNYPSSTNPAQHLGIDLDTLPSATVTSPIDGEVIFNYTAGIGADSSFLILKEDNTGVYHVLGHLDSVLKEKQRIAKGQFIGAVKPWKNADGSDNSHLHWGVNTMLISPKAQGSPQGKWGWGKAPLPATSSQALSRGWLDLGQLFVPAKAVAAPATNRPEKKPKKLFGLIPWRAPEYVRAPSGSPTNGNVSQNRSVETSQRAPTSNSAPCQAAAWSGVVRNIPDLFECDSARAIQSLSQGRQVIISIQSVRFAGGQYIVTQSERPSYANRSVEDMNDKQKSFQWGDWYNATQAKFYKVICVFQASSGSALRQGATITVSARLDTFNGEQILMRCA